MKRAKLVVATIVLAISVATHAEVKFLDDVIAEATSAEMQDLGKLLKQIQMVPVKESNRGKQLMKVTRVEEGSLWDRNGIKVGDLVTGGSSSLSGQKMELKNQLKKSGPQKDSRQ